MTTKEECTIPMVKIGPFVRLDTTLTSQDVMWINDLSGNYGNAGRTISVMIIEQALSNDPKKRKPMDLTGKDIRLQGHDAKGVFKRIALATRILTPEAGTAQITIPKNFYEAVGPYENAAFEIYNPDDDVVISSVPVSFEVYNDHTHMITGDSKIFSDEFEALMNEFKTSSAEEIDEFNEKMSTLLSQISTAQNTADGLKGLLKTWTDLVNSKSVALLNEDNDFSGNMRVKGKVSIDLPMDAYTTGTSIKAFVKENPQQDLNNGETIKSMPPLTSSLAYYSGNNVLNNPLERDYVLVQTNKVSNYTAHQIITLQGGVYGHVKRRLVSITSTGVSYGEWTTVERWGPWENIPLADGIIPRYADKSIPQYRFNGKSIQIRGKFAVTKNHTFTSRLDTLNISKELPANIKSVQYLPQIWSGNFPYTLRIEDNVMYMERIFNADGSSPVTVDTTNLLSLGGSIALDD